MALTGRRSSRAEYSISGHMTLGDLRWLVTQCMNLPDDAAVTTKEFKEHNQMDWDEASIKVSGDMPTDTNQR